ncbi:MAG TPA: uroporphyrinogen decarboxylase family protein, partial [Actinomycetota bacterium]|nr:uroporphyrinogen decarboxylase family protein [Actinomycetota bacterium]
MRAALAMELERPDRPPVGLWGHSFLDEWSPRRLAAATVAAQRRYGWDFVKLQPRATCFAEALGSRYRPSGDRLVRPVLERQAVEAVADWERIAAADPAALAASPPLADQVETVGRVASELGPSIPVIQTVFS